MSAMKDALAERRVRSLSSLPVHRLTLPKCVGEENVMGAYNGAVNVCECISAAATAKQTEGQRLVCWVISTIF